MKKTTNINLGGFVFNIDEDAYQALSNYLTELGKRFSAEEREEILRDIECRMAELLNSQLKNRNVVEISDIEDVIGVIGKPEEFGESTEEKNDFSEPQRQDKKYRKLYRDPENKVIGGVASGIAAYFGIDRVLMRILFIILILISLGWGLLIYLIFLIAMPEAKTTAQLLEMRGIEPSLENINNFHTNSGDYIKSKSTAGNIFKFLLICLGIVIGIIFGICFLGCVIAVFVGLITYTPGGFGDLTDILLLTSVAVFCLCPVIGIIVLCVRAFRNQGRKHKWVGWTLLAIWIISLFAIIFFGIMEGKNFDTDYRIQHSIDQFGNNYNKSNYTNYDWNDDYEDDAWITDENGYKSYSYQSSEPMNDENINEAVDKIYEVLEDKDNNVNISIKANKDNGFEMQISSGDPEGKNSATEKIQETTKPKTSSKSSKVKNSSDTTKTNK